MEMGGTSSATTVSAHEGMATNGMVHLDEGQRAHRDLTGAQRLEATLGVEGDKEILTHQCGSTHVRQAAQVLQVAPHQDGALALLAEGAVDCQNMDMDCGSMRLVQGQSILPREEKERRWLLRDVVHPLLTPYHRLTLLLIVDKGQLSSIG